jgi:integrase/recombinase XerD
MIPLTEAVDDYLAMRRALGYKLTEHGRVLPQFAEFLQQRNEPLITTALALQFAMQPAQASVVWWHQRLAIVRGFAIYLRAFDARHEVPPANLLPAKCRRARPYLFSEAEIEALMQAARAMRPALRAVSCEALVGLLSVTGMRVSEACALDRADVELAAGRLTVRQGKNGRSREIPLHPSTVIALERYALAREELCPHPKDPDAFFLSGGGRRPSRQMVGHWFDQLRRATGLDRETLGRQARLHDVRHAFVLRTLLGWYREGADIEAQLPRLSTVLGHVDPADTYWYFEGAPELLALAADRLERTWEGLASPEPANTPTHLARPRRR